MIGKTATPRGLVILMSRDLQQSLSAAFASIPAPPQASPTEAGSTPSSTATLDTNWQYYVVEPCDCSSDSNCQSYVSLDRHSPLPPLTFIDWNLPTEVLDQLILQAMVGDSVPIAIVDHQNASGVVDAYHRGAAEVLVWPASEAMLRKTLERAVRRIPLARLGSLATEQSALIADCFCLVDRNATIVDCLSSTTASLKVGTNLTSYFSAPHHEAITQQVEQVFTSHRAISMAIEARDQNATMLIDLRIIPCGEDHALVIVRDVASQCAAGDSRLEIAERYRFETAGHMVAGISHEVHQPLYAIANFAGAAINTLRTTPVQDAAAKVIRWCEQITTQSHRAAEIVQRLRRFASVDIATSPVDLPQLVDESIELINGTFRELGVLFEKRFDDSIPAIATHRAQVQQVLLQLLEAACQSLRQVPLDDRIVKVTITRTSDLLCLSVIDSGTGRGESQLGELLGPHFATERSPISMGNALCYALVESLGGTMGRSSEPFTSGKSSGEGKAGSGAAASDARVTSTAWFTLPIVEPPPGAKADQVAQQSPARLLVTSIGR